MSGVSDFIQSHQNAGEREIFLRLHRILSTYSVLQPKIRFGIPFYDYRRWLCYLNPLKKGGVELCFVHGKDLSNEQGLLQFGKRTQVGGIVFHSSDEIREEVLHEIISEAMILDDFVFEQKKKEIKKEEMKIPGLENCRGFPFALIKQRRVRVIFPGIHYFERDFVFFFGAVFRAGVAFFTA